MSHLSSHPSPRQNRVDPWIRLVATPARGLLMGNRGVLHDDKGHIVRTHQVTRWIICLLDFRGRKRTLMQPGRYTELFFLDEATALAAGHRPCAECQRARYQHFLDLWAQTQPGAGLPHAAEVDAALHEARWHRGNKVTYPARWSDLPDGVMVAALDDDQPYLIGQGQLWRWHFTGYTPGPQWPPATVVRVLTPRPTVEILAAGYPVQVHPSLILHPPPLTTLPRSPLEVGKAS
ncbi:MAG: hypothetical protein IT328_15195 [Caldilineaceae bacterium]|nr:hypothetical protein [Caldilineaceae bacterium]